MRTLFLVLLMANLALFGWLRGMFGSFAVPGHEPGRLAQQIAPDRIRLLTDRDVQQLQRRAAERAPAPPAAPQEAAACVQFGDFSDDRQLARLHQRLSEMKLAGRANEVTQDAPGWFRVYLPPAKSQAEAEGRLARLREQGLHDALILRDEGPLRFAIVLGSFKDRDLARKQLAELEGRGIKGARVTDTPTTVRSTRLRFNGADAALNQQMQELQKEFPQQKLQGCGPDA